jgi:hypothetical protein
LRCRGDADDRVRRSNPETHDQPHERFEPLFGAERQADDMRLGPLDMAQEPVMIGPGLQVDLPAHLPEEIRGNGNPNAVVFAWDCGEQR